MSFFHDPFEPEPLPPAAMHASTDREGVTGANEHDPGTGDGSAKAFAAGCYLINITLSDRNHVIYDGVVRVERNDSGYVASGDLYQRALAQTTNPQGAATLVKPPAPSDGIPSFPRAQYRYYLRITRLAQDPDQSVIIQFENWRYVPINQWTKDNTLTAHLLRAESTSSAYVGALKDAAGIEVGQFSMEWVSAHLRKASIQINHVTDSEPPIGVDTRTWQDVFDAVQWDVATTVSDFGVAEISGDGWSDAELHAAMLNLRGQIDLDEVWRFHILAVHRLKSTDRGIMYDAGATDSDNVPREGIGVSSHWVVPDDDMWGMAKGLRVGSLSNVYFRTAVHEIGHALGLFHNSVDNGFMATTDRIASRGTAAVPFPTNVLWSFASDDQRRLKHYPDPFVRPGGARFGDASDPPSGIAGTTDAAMQDSSLKLRVSPLLEVVPIGAPVRLLLELRNDDASVVLAPRSLSFKSGHVSGEVIDPSGTRRGFKSLYLCIEESKLAPLSSRQSISHALTLLRGGSGALFPNSGLFRILVRVNWHLGDLEVGVAGETSVFVMPPQNEAEASAARTILTTPDAHMTLIVGGDHLKSGIAAIGNAIASKALRTHYAYIEARRLGEGFRRRRPDLRGAANLIEVDTVMSSAEIKRAAELVSQSALNDDDDEAARQIARTLKRKVQRMFVPEQVQQVVDKLRT